MGILITTPQFSVESTIGEDFNLTAASLAQDELRGLPREIAKVLPCKDWRSSP